MLKKDEPLKQIEGSEEDDTSKNHCVFVKLALLQSKDVFVSTNPIGLKERRVGFSFFEIGSTYHDSFCRHVFILLVYF